MHGEGAPLPRTAKAEGNTGLSWLQRRHLTEFGCLFSSKSFRHYLMHSWTIYTFTALGERAYSTPHRQKLKESVRRFRSGAVTLAQFWSKKENKNNISHVKLNFYSVYLLSPRGSTILFSNLTPLSNTPPLRPDTPIKMHRTTYQPKIYEFIRRIQKTTAHLFQHSF